MKKLLIYAAGVASGLGAAVALGLLADRHRDELEELAGHASDEARRLWEQAKKRAEQSKDQ